MVESPPHEGNTGAAAAAPTAVPDDALEAALAWRTAGHGVALATVVRTWGSSPRPVGSQLAVRDDGVFAGSVSGGCVEGAVVREAAAVIESGTPGVLEFGVSNEQAWAVGLACGGEIEILLHRVEHSLKPIVDARDRAVPCVLVTRFEDAAQALIVGGDCRALDPVFGEAVRASAGEALGRDNHAIVESPAGRVFVHVFNPPLRMLVVGAVHIAQALVPMAAISGYAVTLIDPRRAFASPERFARGRIVHEWPHEALAALRPDPRTAIVVLSHDPKLDDPALATALDSDAFYIGALGSRRTHAARIERLRERGYDTRAVARIHGPVGLPIGARSPAEIAIAILAEATRELHGSR